MENAKNRSGTCKLDIEHILQAEPIDEAFEFGRYMVRQFYQISFCLS